MDIKGQLKKIIKELINYRNKVKNSYWRSTKDFLSEKDLHNDIYSFLSEEGRFPGQIQNNPEFRDKNKPDLVIKGIPLDVKLSKTPIQIKKIRKIHFSRILQYCSNSSSRTGFLIVPDISSQKHRVEPLDFEDVYFELEEKEEFPRLIVIFFIRGG